VAARTVTANCTRTVFGHTSGASLPATRLMASPCARTTFLPGCGASTATVSFLTSGSLRMSLGTSSDSPTSTTGLGARARGGLRSWQTAGASMEPRTTLHRSVRKASSSLAGSRPSRSRMLPVPAISPLLTASRAFMKLAPQTPHRQTLPPMITQTRTTKSILGFPTTTSTFCWRCRTTTDTTRPNLAADCCCGTSTSVLVADTAKEDSTTMALRASPTTTCTTRWPSCKQMERTTWNGVSIVAMSTTVLPRTMLTSWTVLVTQTPCSTPCRAVSLKLASQSPTSAP